MVEEKPDPATLDPFRVAEMTQLQRAQFVRRVLDAYPHLASLAPGQLLLTRASRSSTTGPATLALTQKLGRLDRDIDGAREPAFSAQDGGDIEETLATLESGVSFGLPESLLARTARARPASANCFGQCPDQTPPYEPRHAPRPRTARTERCSDRRFPASQTRTKPTKPGPPAENDIELRDVT